MSRSRAMCYYLLSIRLQQSFAPPWTGLFGRYHRSDWLASSMDGMVWWSRARVNLSASVVSCAADVTITAVVYGLVRAHSLHMSSLLRPRSS